MKNFTLNVIMAVAVMMGMSLNVNAALYNDLDEAHEALEKGLNEANELFSKWMDEKIHDGLKDAKEAATAVWDTANHGTLEEIEAVMPTLNDAIEKATASAAEYAALSKVLDAYTAKMQTFITTKNEEYTEKYGETENWDALEAALAEYDTYFIKTVNNLKSNVTREMLDAANNGTFVVEDNIELVSIDDVVEGVLAGKDFDDIVTGISSVVVAPADSNVAYGLNGNKVSENYKGIVIKGGKKYVVK